MGCGNFFQLSICSMSLFFLLFFDTCNAHNRSIGQIHPGFQATHESFADNGGIFLVSNDSMFGFGFKSIRDDETLFLLTIVYMDGTTIVWSANRDSPVQNSDAFKFDNSGNAFLERAGSVVWETGTTNKGVSVMELHDYGNLVMFDNQKKVIWDSFSDSTDTLLPNQIHPGFQASYMNFAFNDGNFLNSNNSKFGFGFTPVKRDDETLFLLTIVYMDGTTIVWSANRDSPVKNSDAFKFDNSGNAFLEQAGTVVWETGTTNKGVSVMELQDSGNLVMFDDQKNMIWDSFSHPTNTLLPNQIRPGFQETQVNFADNGGIFLASNNSMFTFGFTPAKRDDVNLFLLTIVYMDMDGTTIIVWSANRDSPVQNSDAFMFDKSGNAFLERAGGSAVWETGTTNKGVSVMELQDSGNLIMFDDQKKVIWDSFSHPTDTLLPNQNFREGMKLVSVANSKSNVSYFLEIKSGDMRLYAGYATPQPYWSLAKDNRKIINESGGRYVFTAVIDGNSWRFLDRSNVSLWQFIFPESSDVNGSWMAVLDSEGFITFTNLQINGTSTSELKIPPGSCSTPDSCGQPYHLCTEDNRCKCPSFLSPRGCETGISSPCNDDSGSATELVSTGDGVDYFALPFIQPYSITDLKGCKSSCHANCSCLALFFESKSGHCFMFDQVGSFQGSFNGFESFVKVSSISGNGTDTNGNHTNGNRGGTNKRFLIIIIIPALIVLLGLLYGGHRYYRKQRKEIESPEDTSEEDNISGNSTNNRSVIRFRYKDLQTFTNNFTVKLGKGGFGSVYLGTLADGAHIAVKKLEGVGQGKKEFKAEVNTIGCIHHLHLVRLRGFCTEGGHRLLVYEYMGNGSLEKWIFKKNKGGLMLDWDTRYNIALGTAKGLAYLHEECDVKVVHCDIKPENILLDDDYQAKVSDFGLAKLMTKEQSHAFTTLRGTRGYLAPEWIKNYALSEKCDVYSYGMVLLEIIGGRKNYDPSESSEKFNFPSYALKMMEDGNLKEILDSKLQIDEHDERLEIAIKVALWCIQEDMAQRPSMTKVVQMLEGVSIVPTPPSASSGPSDCSTEAYLSTVGLSGPR